LCVEGNDQGCYFYSDRQAKAGNLKTAHDAYLVVLKPALAKFAFSNFPTFTMPAKGSNRIWFKPIDG
jgi:hypothetical protein